MEEAGQNSGVARQFLLRFLLIWGPLTLLLAVVVWVLFRTQADATLATVRNAERHTLQLSTGIVAAELHTLRGDALYLAQQSSLKGWLETGTPAARARLSADFLAFARNRKVYDQIRFLDRQGQEVVRVNWDHGHPKVVPPDALQNKADRYYVRDTLALAAGNVYVSPFDLNIEHHRIEQPIKPMIRLGTPVFDPAGVERGAIVLNYLGARLLGRLRSITDGDDHGVWLLNAGGYWLAGPRPALDWGFMYPQRRGTRFADLYGQAVWSRIKTGPEQSQFLADGDLFTYVKLPLAGVFGADAGQRHWLLVSRVSRTLLAARVAGYARSLGVTFVIATLFLALVSAMIAYYSMRRRQSEMRVRASEVRFRGLLDAAPDAFVIVDAQGDIALVNAQAERWFGYARDELVGRPVETLVPERYRERHRGDRDGYLAGPQVRAMGEGAELFALRKGGSEFPVEISLSPLETETGRLVIGIVRDITARKRAEEARRAVQARYRELVDNLPVGVYRNTFGSRGRFLEVNPAMVEMFEAGTAEALLAYPLDSLYCDSDAAAKFAAKIAREGHVNGEELRLRTLKGREFEATVSAVVKRDASGQPFLDGIVEDTSARKESEQRIQQLNAALRERAIELEAINGELEAFSYSVSHDLRSPLRAIDGFSRILLDEYAERLDEKGQDRLRRVRAATQRMAALIDDLLTLSRVTRTELQHEPVALSELAGEVMDELRKADPQRAVRFSVQPGLTANGDPRLLRIVLENLLGNAWKYTGKEPDARIELGCRSEDTPPTYYVRDNGVGFDMAYAGKLFGAFQRLHDASEFPGTGIGLATVQRVIHKHGGRIWAESEVGRGTTFYFTLRHAETP